MAKTTCVNPDVLQRVAREVDEPLILRLAVYARWRMDQMGFTRGKYPRVGDPEDVALDAIERVLKGTRRWDPDARPDLFQYLKTVVDSIVRDFFRQSSVIHERDESAAGHFNDDGAPDLDMVPQGGTDDASITTLVALDEHLRDEPDLQELVYLLIDRNTPREAAQRLGWTVTEVNNARKRLARRIRGFLCRGKE